MADARAAVPPARGMSSRRRQDRVAELPSPCAEFRVQFLQISGKQMYEAFRVSGQGPLYSVATGDLDELHAVLREACPGGSGG
jgi:hypothetical protein